MIRRILTAVPLAALVGWLILQQSEWLFVLAVLIVAEIGLHEFFEIGRNAGLPSMPWLGYAGAIALLLAQAAELRNFGHSVPFTLALLALIVPIAGLLHARDLKAYLTTLATTFWGIIYVAFTLSFLIPLRFSDPQTGRGLTVLLFLVIWGNDIFAYAVGRWIGRTFPYPGISPQKTVEGSVAGLAAAAVVGLLFARYYWNASSLLPVVIVSLLIALSAQAGDLVESAMKREANMKDSSALLPGHGGLLDRIDSLLFGVPILWLVVELRGLWRI